MAGEADNEGKHSGNETAHGSGDVGCVGVFWNTGWRYLSDPLTTTLAYTYEVEESMDLSGYVVRQEQVITDSSGSGLMQIQRGEGERVSAGGTVAAVYADQASLDRQNEMEQLRIQIEQLQYAQERRWDRKRPLKLDAQIMQSILDYRSSISADKLYDAEKEGAQLRAWCSSGTIHMPIPAIWMHNRPAASQLQTLRSQAAGPSGGLRRRSRDCTRRWWMAMSPC